MKNNLERNAVPISSEKKEIAQLVVEKRNKAKEFFQDAKILSALERCAVGLPNLDLPKIVAETRKNVFNGVGTSDIEQAVIFSAASYIEHDPSYSFLAARLFLQKIRKEVFGRSTVQGSTKADQEYKESFKRSIKLGVEKDLLDKRMGQYNLDLLADKLDFGRDNLLQYMGVHTLYERYLIKTNGRRLEMPQTFWMRVAMGLALQEKQEDREKWAIKFYNTMSQLLCVPSTPTLFHAGTSHPQLASCFLSMVPDDLKKINKSMGDNAELAKWSGGVATSYSSLRACGAFIKTTKVDSQGVIPFLKIENDWTIAINRSGKRRGAKAVYLSTHHLDIEDFIDLRRRTGDERRRTPDMDTVNWIPDEFILRAIKDEDWTLFSPDETEDLEDLYGKAFKKRYEEYEAMAAKGEIKLFKKVNARKFMRRMITVMFETGRPWWCFKDPCNIRSPQDHVGVVRCSNLCCVAGSERVVTQFGLLTAEELYLKNKPLKLIGTDGVIDSTPMLLPRPNAPMVKICTQEGYTHSVTPDHKVWVVDYGYKEAQKLEFGDKIALQPHSGIWGRKEMEKEAFLIGLSTGDGTFGGTNNAYIDVWEKDFFIIPYVQNCVADVLKRYQPICEFDHACKLVPEFGNKDNGKSRLSSSALNDVFGFLGYKKENKLKVPDSIWRSNKSSVSAYLSGLYLADGTVEGGTVTVCSLCSTSKEFLEEIQILWANFGARTSLTLMEDAGMKELPDGMGGTKEYYCNAKYRLMHTSIQSCNIAENVTSLGNHRKNSAYLSNLKKNGYAQKMYCTFEHLEKLHDQDAYCVSVESKDHLWTCNGILTKNTEITENTWNKVLKEPEIAVCNLNSIVVVNHLKLVNGKWVVDWEKLEDTSRTAVRMADNVIDLNFYPVEEAKISNLRHRPIGIGSMGWQDACWRYGVNLEDSGEFQDQVQEFMSYHIIDASSDLSAERGAYSTFEGSKWDRGIFPLDTIDLLEQERGFKINVNRNSRLDWTSLKGKVKKQGMRNSNTQAQAPTATIANIVAVTPCGEGKYKNIYVKENMSGSFVILNEFLVEDLKAIGLWSRNMLDKIKFFDGSVQSITEIPQEIRLKYKEAFELDQTKMIDLCAIRGKWIDQSQSFNVFYKGNDGNELEGIYLYIWASGLKTSYYCRTLAVSQVEKSTLDTSFGFTQKRDQGMVESPVLKKELTDITPVDETGDWDKYVQEQLSKGVKLCKIDDPTCESCQ